MAEDPQDPEDKTFSIRLAGIKTADDPASLAMELFATEVNRNSGGTISVTTYPNSVLGRLPDLLIGMVDNTVDMLHNTISCYPWLDGARSFAVVSAPFIWRDNDELQGFLDSDTGKGWMEEAAEATGVRVLIARGELPPRQLTSTRPITHVDDFSGLTVRTAESAIVQETMMRLGATPVVIPFADLYMALKTGVADAQENNFITAVTKSFYEVQSYFMQTDYSRDVSAIFISDAVWQEMSDFQQQVMFDAAEKAVDLEERLVAEKLKGVREYLEGKVTFVEIDVESIREKLGADIFEEFDEAGELWPTGTIAGVLEFQEKHRR